MNGPALKLEDIYVSTFCNFAHRLVDGKPIEHECRVLPPRALQHEIQGDIPGAIAILQATPAVWMRRGVRRREAK